jgi:hypothetical protein
MLKAGIVGLPNVGKSTLFNALIRSHKAAAANNPFCTIEPNLGVVTGPDPRLDALAQVVAPNVSSGMRSPERGYARIPTTIEFLDIAGLKVPADMQGRSLVPLLKGQRPADWRTAWYYRYYHDPGHHKTAAHYGVRTETHKLIYFWKKDQWELYDLEHDPLQWVNLWDDPARRAIRDDLLGDLADHLVALSTDRRAEAPV